MKLVDLKVNEYLDVLKSDVPAPGGGSVSALAGAQGAGLFMMGCRPDPRQRKICRLSGCLQRSKGKGTGALCKAL